MLKHDLKIVLRRLVRQRFHTAIGVAVLALGLVCFIAANLFASYVRNYDRHWPNAERIYVVAERIRATEFGVTPAFDTRSDAPIAELLRIEAPELSAVARLYSAWRSVAVDERRLTVPVAYAEPQFTELFELPALSGDSNDALAAPRSAVITRRWAERLFGAVDVAGRLLTLNMQQPVDVTIRAVVADFPEQSHLKQGGLFASGAELFVSWDVLETFERLNTNWGGRVVNTYALLPADGTLTPSELERRLAMIAAERVPADRQFLKIDLGARPVSAVAALTAQNAFQGAYGGSVWVDILTALRVGAAAILAIACLNCLNLSMALGAGRVVDVSTRKVLGATMSQIVRQDLWQTAIVVLLALTVAVAAVVPLSKLFAAPWSVSLALPWSEPWFVVFLAGTLGGVTVAAGLYPALVAARARRAAGAQVGGASDALARLRTGLVGLQFAAASALVVTAIVLLMQRNELHDALVGRFADQYVGLYTELGSSVDPDVIANELMRGPGIRGTTTTNGTLFQSPPRLFARAPEDAGVMMSFVYTGHDYFPVMDIPLVAGRAFARDRADDVIPLSNQEWIARHGSPQKIVLDRAAARALGWPDPTAAVGELIFAPGGVPHEVIGIVEDVVTTVHSSGERGAAYVLSPPLSQLRIVRIASDRVEAALAHIDEVARSSLFPGTSRVFLDRLFESAYWGFELTNRVLTGLAAFALLISGIGLFGMASYLANRRTREIGIRKVQGATPAGILRLLLWDFSKPVVWANLAAWPLALIALDRYLSLFAERVAITPLPFALALAATWALACLAVGACAWRAAKLHPAEALRN